MGKEGQSGVVKVTADRQDKALQRTQECLVVFIFFIFVLCMISISVFVVLCIVYCKLRKLLSFVLCVSSIVREESAIQLAAT